MKILLIDDEQAILDVFKQALEAANFQVITALTGSSGMDTTKKEHPDVIFLDQVLPDMNGNQVLQQLKADPETKAIPIAILSNFSQDTLVANAMKMGASDYILKYQIAPQDLAAKANGLLQELHAVPPAPQVAKPVPAQPAASPAAAQPAAQPPVQPVIPVQSATAPVQTPAPAQPVQNPVNPVEPKPNQ